MKKITLLGSSSGRNAGDAALIAGIMDAIDADCDAQLTYEIPTIRPSYIENNYHNHTVPVGMMPWHLSLKMLGLPTYQSVARSDLSLIFDAILFDRSLFNPLFNYMSSLALMLPSLKRKGARFACYNVGLGPVDSAPGRRMLREILEMSEFITVRDQSALSLLQELGVVHPRVRVTADAALTMPGADEIRVASLMKKLGFSLEEEVVGVNINKYLDTWARPKRPSIGREKFLKVYAEGLNRFAKATGVPLLFITTQHHDVPLTEELMSLIDPAVRTAIFTNVEHNHYEVKGIMGRLSMLFGMRLHATILGSSALCPTVGIAYQPKVEYFFDILGLSDRCIRFDEFSPERIVHLMTSAWEDRSELRAHLKKRIPELQREALRPARVVGGLHRGLSIEEAWKLMEEEKTTPMQVGDEPASAS